MKQSKSSNSINLARLRAKFNIRDKFCWHCHQECSSGSIDCTKCFRTFHNDCLEPTDADPFICSVCNLLEIAKTELIGRETVLDTLKYVLANILKTPKYEPLGNLQQMRTHPLYKSCNPIDLDEIRQKIENQLYDSFYALQVDVKCIYHNCAINVRNQYCWLRAKAELADDLQELVKIDCKSILMCPGCYENKQLHPNRWGVMTCGQRHHLLWIKVTPNLSKILIGEKSTRWPVKVLAQYGDELMVYLFGYSVVVCVPNNDWLFYTGKPFSMLWTNQSPAIKELNKYLDSVWNTLGTTEEKSTLNTFTPLQPTTITTITTVKQPFLAKRNLSTNVTQQIGSKKRRIMSDLTNFQVKPQRNNSAKKTVSNAQSGQPDKRHHKEIAELKKQIENEKDAYKKEIHELKRQYNELMAQKQQLINKTKNDIQAIQDEKTQMQLNYENQYTHLVQQINGMEIKCDWCNHVRVLVVEDE